jgi:hypothetical protein
MCGGKSKNLIQNLLLEKSGYRKVMSLIDFLLRGFIGGFSSCEIILVV